MKNKTILLRLNDEEMKEVEYLRKEKDINIASFLRRCLKNKYNELNEKGK
jgi:hypothetical protein